MYLNKTIIGFGLRMISRIIRIIIKDNSWYHAHAASSNNCLLVRIASGIHRLSVAINATEIINRAIKIYLKSKKEEPRRSLTCLTAIRDSNWMKQAVIYL